MQITAGDKHIDKFSWGEGEQLHHIECDDGRRFNLFDVIEVEATIFPDLEITGKLTGEIVFITEDSISLLSTGKTESLAQLPFDRIRAICLDKSES